MPAEDNGSKNLSMRLKAGSFDSKAFEAFADEHDQDNPLVRGVKQIIRLLGFWTGDKTETNFTITSKINNSVPTIKMDLKTGKCDMKA